MTSRTAEDLEEAGIEGHDEKLAAVAPQLSSKIEIGRPRWRPAMEPPQVLLIGQEG
jgi:hypothetical protein